MARLFLVRGCMCLPKLCALKVMLHKRLEEDQECVWEQTLGHVGQWTVALWVQYEYELGRRGRLYLKMNLRFKIFSNYYVKQLIFVPPHFSSRLSGCWQSTTLPSGGLFSVSPLPSSNHHHHHHHKAGNEK